jgi:homoserine kinase
VFDPGTLVQTVTAFAPATVANVGIGFDILGHTVQAVGDRVRLERIAEPVVRIRAITGIAGDLPVDPARNTAGRAVQAMHGALGLPFGFELTIEKGIPLASGMGGSAASAVAAVVAANAMIETPLSPLRLLKFAMEGEIVASGSAHVDNIAPCLFGGLVLTVGIDHPRVKQIPVPSSVRCVLVHPHMHLGTREARAVLKSDVTRSDFVWQTANLAGFISGCYSNDLDMIRDSFNDVIIEPQRQILIPGFKDVQSGAMAAGALGCSISGAGPSVFAWAEAERAEPVRGAMVAAFARHSLDADSWISALDNAGARLVDS